MAEETSGGDGGAGGSNSTFEAFSDYTLKTFKLKQDKWSKFMTVNDNVVMLTKFLEKGDSQVLLISLSSAGTLQCAAVFPSSLRNKTIYFVKRHKEPVKKGKFHSLVMCGEMSAVPLDQLITLVDSLVVPMLSNNENHSLWPNVVSQVVMKHTGGLKGDVLVVSGQVKGKTLLPMSPQAEMAAESVSLEEGGPLPERQLVHSIETVVIDWCHQVRDVLKKRSAQALLDGSYPGPLVEIDFWKARWDDLESIVEQLSVSKVVKMSKLLEVSVSSYYPAYQGMVESVNDALIEARDISIHLTALRRHYEDLDDCDFLELPRKFPAIFHVVCLIWAHSEHYRKPARLVVLLQEMSNQLVTITRGYVTEEILHVDPEEGIDRLQDALKVCLSYKSSFSQRKNMLPTYFKDPEVPLVEWSFQPDLVFSRLDGFVQQLYTIETYFQTVVEFLKLEKIVFGGKQGGSLSVMVVQIFTEFVDLQNKFNNTTYDPLNIDKEEFSQDMLLFDESVAVFDQRLGSILCRAFEDCSGCEAAFKLLDMVGTLIERPIICSDFNHKYPVLVQWCDEELDQAKSIYDRQLALMNTPQGPVLNKNMPRAAGVLKWCQELRDRVNSSMDKFKSIENGTLETAEAMLVIQKHVEMMALIAKLEAEVYQEWIAGVDEVAKINLEKPLLLRASTGSHLSVNFDPQLIALLREVKYFSQRVVSHQPIPERALSVFSQNDTYNMFTQNLDVIVSLYNCVRETVIEVEFPLIKEQLSAIDEKLEKAITTLNWTSEGVWEYIQETRDVVRDLEQRVRLSKANVELMRTIMAGWSQTPLYQRKEDKKDTLLYLEDRETLCKNRYARVTADGQKILELVKHNLDYFQANEESEEWGNYIQYLDGIVLDGFFNCLFCSLQFLLFNTDKEKQDLPGPLLEAKLELQAPDMFLTPTLEQDAPDGFYRLVEGLIDDIFKFGTLMPRLTKQHQQPDYLAELDEIAELSDMKDEILSRVSSAITQSMEFCQSYENYAYLWVDDRNEFLRQFLIYGHVLTPEEVEEAGNVGVPETPPSLNQFNEQVDSYEKIHSEVEQFQGTTVFNLWFRIDSRPFKQGLLNIVKRWSYMFKQHLIDHVTSSLNDLELFIKTTVTGLGLEVEEGDYDGLVDMMSHLMAVKDKQTIADNMFEPLKATIELLKTYGQELSDDVHLQVQELPEQWNNVKKQAVLMKQAVAPLQATEVGIIRRKLASFDVKQHEFREKFRYTSPFEFDAKLDNVYSRIDKASRSVGGMESQMKELSQSASLFEVNVPDYKQLKTCRKEVIMLKTLWDMIVLVKSSFSDWNTTLWCDINVDQMEIDCRKFVKDIRGLDKEMRAWDAFNGLDSMVKNMVTSLRAVGELQNPAIRDRHWEQLMNATQVKFVMSDETNLADLLALNLHKFEDEVRNIVDKSTKELSMEKTLKELDVTWAQMEFDHNPHSSTGVKMIGASEELIETLEDNQVQLQNMMTSKFVGYFLEQVSEWQKKLSTSDSVITIWFEVQRTWSHLESIFLSSEDIRTQLPEHSKMFDTIDSDFKGLMKDAENTPNVVKVCNKQGLFDELEDLQKRLAICEKALAEYLETKRLAFPRFYFVSSADLLDILSKGNQPVEVSRHLAKLFDSMSSLKFTEDASGVSTKEAVGMYSKDGEYVEFDANCQCDGQVEVWLNSLLDTMMSTIRHEMTEAVVSYEEKPRDQWLFDPPAQVALTGTQIWWTTEVNLSFTRLEEGYENALKDYYRKQVSQLNTLIGHLLGELTKGDRQKIMTICTIDVHARDVVAKLISQKIDNSQAFIWLSQLRHRWDEEKRHCFGNICDAEFLYSYEYLGNTPRLVITPLTDRCYITLTQSLHLTMSGAPAGPAGTGKTETTKDLGRALGIMVYVFNCSEQMDYKSCGNIYKGLAQTGAWGCFDEFNRISVEVLSVVAVQVKSIQDAIHDKKKRFIFEGFEIRLTPSVGLFITMNPGYAGRTELPENLKALFRPCAMVVPDFELIAEIMLVAEGFIEARILARKFLTLYTLCKELLSKQDHYDWGLRAIKSVLVVAGTLKRGDKGRPEDQVLMRALRDFNTPKIVTDDVTIFMGLIGDLFPALNVPRKRDMDFEETVKKSVIDLGLQPEDNFVLKVVQLEELIHVRHSVFVIGNAGTGKTKILRSLNKTYSNMKRKPLWQDLNPKAVTNDELFGYINSTTREWKDGLFSSIMRDLANIPTDSPKWIVLDGDIDPMWIESLNTVMDDNKVLTLASNERVPLNPSMRLMFEISHLKAATPATVSRAGILFANPSDLGWNPYVQSWIDTRVVQSEKANLTILFDRYVPTCLETLRYRFKKITPVTEISMIQTLCYLLEAMLTPVNTPPDTTKEIYEHYFVFAAVWAFGGSMFQDQLADYRVEFSKWWVSEFKAVKFPHQGTVFDYYLCGSTNKWNPWTEKLPIFELDPEIPLQSVLVHTAETVRIRYFLDLLMGNHRPVMLVGGAGCGKTVLVNDKLNSMREETFITTIPFNHYTTSLMLQGVMEKPLEKKAGRNYGPPGTKRLIYFIDDMNMPEVDTYGTVQPHTLIRQHLDYQHWYDRNKLTLKEIHNVQYVACMNPTAGSFTINPRLQRHFSVFAVSFPGSDALKTIYHSILSQHIAHSSFSGQINKCVDKIVVGAIKLHSMVSITFLPTAIKFHYIFNLRDLSNIFQGILFSTLECLNTPLDFVRLWLHEASRVYADKLLDEKDMQQFNKLKFSIAKDNFDDLDDEALKADPLIFCHFANGIGEPRYLPVPSWASLSKTLKYALESYNEINAVMNLVLFEDAMQHVCRINRILESPRGNALLVGVGGSGKQSLTRLAASVSGLEVFQIQLKQGYGVGDLKADLAQMYIKAGLKSVGTVFLLTDAQIPDETFLVLINDLLASGEIPDLFAGDEYESIIAGVRNEVKMSGLQDTRENCWSFFIDRVRKQLKVVLCFSPVGATLRVRSRKFPAIVNCTSIDWFHAWPDEALMSVSTRFLSEVELIPSDLCPSISRFMAFVHTSVNEMSKQYLANERRYNYTTPKSFLELINLYQNLLRKKHGELLGNMERLEGGLEKLKSTASQVDDLKEKLAAQEVELKQKNDDADALIKRVGIEQEKVSKEKEIADGEETKVGKITEEVSKKQQDCERDLVKAEPALKAAAAALNTLNKANLTELKSFGKPPAAVINVTAAVMVLLAPPNKIPKDRSWNAAKVVMSKVDQFLDNLIKFDKENIADPNRKAIRPYLDNSDFDPDFIRNKSTAAAGLCSWVINIVGFFEVFCDVEPKRKALAAANAELAAAQEKLSKIKGKIKDLDDNLAELTKEFEEATSAKLRCQQQAEATASTISLANRLVGGLASEKVRWAESIEKFKQEATTLAGDVLLTSSYLSYVGCFGRNYRTDLLETKWMECLKTIQPAIPMTEDLDVLFLLTDGATIARWNNEKLPSDRMSVENATILTNAERWPLMIDPQLQGIKWIKTREGDQLQIVRLGQKGYLDTIERAVSNGDCLLLENIGESVDPVLDPLLGRLTIKKGKYIKIGDKEIEYHPNFRLILQTKLANPHYKPEMQAQATLINFTVTKDGLEEQLLAEVVATERPDLERTKAELTKQQNDFKIKLKELEDSLLSRLSSAGGNFLGDTALVENLETTKRTAAEIEQKVAEAKVTEKKINEARENYRPAAARASLLYFILNDLNKINPLYQFSLKTFSVVFHKAIERAEESDDVKQRILNLIDSITYSVFVYTTRGLFERDKLTFTSQVTFQVLLMNNQIDPLELDFLLRFPAVPNVTSPVDFLSNFCWGGIKALSNLEQFKNLDRDIEGSAKRWKKFVDSECPEKEKYPQEWKNKNSLQKLCMMRALRPDRMTYAVTLYVEEQLGHRYIEKRTIPFEVSYEETGPATPVFFVLSPGVNPLKDVEAVGRKLGFTLDNGNFHNVSLGQGQEIVAENALDIASKEGHWVILQNIHLVAKWLSKLEKKLETYSEGSHSAYRVYMSAEPAPTPDSHIIPQGVLESSIKITNEPPTGMLANLHKALDNFTQETLEMCSRENEFKSLLFSLVYFHAVLIERRKFGPQGWNRPYPFTTGDLTISVNVLYNYLEANAKVPWTDLRYLFGEIMYGGHITDDWDRRLCKTYLEVFMKPEQLDGELLLAPGFATPPNLDYIGYHKYISENLPPESPYLYGMHSNAEIGFLTTTSENLFRTVLEMQPRDSSGAGASGTTREEKVF
ncbi:dynein beta chain, ciliary-like isoform X3 [Halichondria panicea]|uniref:dynein beta chain, ciliary-like isoform X3 n=1 Tax=Halichondria panicea TaxID=6063 RepID=UPI00312BB72C